MKSSARESASRPGNAENSEISLHGCREENISRRAFVSGKHHGIINVYAWRSRAALTDNRHAGGGDGINVDDRPVPISRGFC